MGVAHAERQREDAAELPKPNRIHGATLAKILLWIGLALLVWQAANLLLMAFAGVLLALVFDAVANRIARWTGVGRGVAVAAAVLLLVGALGAIGWLLGAQIVQQADRLVGKLPEYLDQLEEQLRSSEVGQILLGRISPAGDGEGVGVASGLLAEVKVVGVKVITVLGNAALVLAIGIFFVAQPQLYRGGLLLLTPPRLRPRAETIADLCDYNLRWWAVGKVLIMFLLAVLTTLGLLLIGTPYALTFGVLAGVLSFIPYFGPVLSFIPPALVAASESTEMLLFVGGLYIVIQTVESYVITPLVQQSIVKLPPALTILFQVLMTLLLGVGGLVFAVPLLVVLLIVVKIAYVEAVLGEHAPIPGRE